MNATEIVDSDGNRERIDMYMNVAGYGQAYVSQVFDFKNMIYSEYVPATGSCKKIQLGFTVNIREALKRITDPEGGFTEYLGETQPEWDTDSTFYTFKVKNVIDRTKAPQTFYFNTETKTLEWIAMDESEVSQAFIL